jgi:hypothetical protein
VDRRFVSKQKRGDDGDVLSPLSTSTRLFVAVHARTRDDCFSSEPGV